MCFYFHYFLYHLHGSNLSFLLLSPHIDTFEYLVARHGIVLGHGEALLVGGYH